MSAVLPAAERLVLQYREVGQSAARRTIEAIDRVGVFAFWGREADTGVFARFRFYRVERATIESTGEVIRDLRTYLGVRRPGGGESAAEQAAQESQPVADPGADAVTPPRAVKARPPNESLAARSKREKRDLFACFGPRVLRDQYRSELIALFDNRCFKCGAAGRLDIDHHVPNVQGGHFVPGNLVALCKRCNNLKAQSMPSAFYNADELERLAPRLAEQAPLFHFVFDWSRWNSDREGYLLEHGVPADLVAAVLTDEDHPNYVGLPRDPLIRYEIRVADFLDVTNTDGAGRIDG